MADFIIALAQTLVFEGAYSNDPTDTGGETYCGVSRVHNPDWHGWALVDARPLEPRGEARLIKHVEDFYKELWDRLGLDYIDHQNVAEELFDISVNMGMGRAVKFLQTGLNAMNRDQKLWPDLAVDGGYGPVTKGVFGGAVAEYDLLAKVLVILRGAFYLDIVSRNTTQERFIRGWFSRLQILVRHQAP